MRYETKELQNASKEEALDILNQYWDFKDVYVTISRRLNGDMYFNLECILPPTPEEIAAEERAVAERDARLKAARQETFLRLKKEFEPD
jgi:hypothetical protein